MQFMRTQADAPLDVTRSLRRAVVLLRLLSTHSQIGWRLSDLASQAQLDPATVHRLLAGLCDERLATRVPGTLRYTLGPLAFELGIAAEPYFNLDRAAGLRLAALATELGGTLYLKVRSGADSVCIARHDGSHTVLALLLEVGGRRPLCLTAGGVAMLVRLPRAQQQDIERQNRDAMARHSDTRWPGVRRMLRRSRQCGFGLNLGDIVPGICTVSVALLSASQAPVASLGLALATGSLSESHAAELASVLGAEAMQLQQQLARFRF